MRRRDFVVGLAVAGIPAPAQARQPVAPKRVGLLISTAESEAHEQAAVVAFLQSLAQRGWVRGRNLEVAVRWGAGNAARMARNAREIVGLAPDAIAVRGANLPALAQLTSTIPIVFVFPSDAVAARYVGSLAQPGGNITGFASDERRLVGKRLGLLRLFDPRISRVLYLRSRNIGADTDYLYRRIAADAKPLGVEIIDGQARDEADIERAFASFARGPNGGLVVAFDAFNTTHRPLIVALAAKHRLPAVYASSFFAENGGLLSYGFEQDAVFRQGAFYVDRILRGAKPADLPVQEPTRFELAINLKTAKALGLTVPQILLAQADEVIQ
jgi:putative ABC transport system substrate-binding protein